MGGLKIFQNSSRRRLHPKRAKMNCNFQALNPNRKKTLTSSHLQRSVFTQNHYSSSIKKSIQFLKTRLTKTEIVIFCKTSLLYDHNFLRRKSMTILIAQSELGFKQKNLPTIPLLSKKNPTSLFKHHH